jgi:hypothetical protein
MNRKIILFTTIIAFGLLVQSAGLAADEVYLKYNLRYDGVRNSASCINYQNGLMVPAGSKVKIISYSSKVINIQIEAGLTIKMDYSPKFTGMSAEKWIAQVTSAKDPSPAWKKFTELEWKGIHGGKALDGMRKDAVVVALGYPSKHKTPSLELDRWLYWANRVATFGVIFSNDKVTDVGHAGR